MYPSAKGISLYGKQTGREPNTKKKLVIDPFRCNSDPQTVQLNETDLKSGPDSAILVGESTKGTKLEGAYKKKSTQLEQTNHTITILPAGSNKATIISKRDISKQPLLSEFTHSDEQPTYGKKTNGVSEEFPSIHAENQLVPGPSKRR